MKILLTGSNGYIAQYLIKFLKNYEITCLNRGIADLTDLDTVNNFFNKHEKFDALIHTAITGGSRLKSENSKTIDDNLKMYYNILAHRDKFNKFISFGSGAEIHAPNTPYGLSKKVISESIKNKENFFNLRIFGVFDENELETRFIKSNIIRYINKKPIEIFENKKMDFFFMEDLCSLIEYYLNNAPIKEINCVYKQKYSLLQVAEIINQLSEYKVEIINKEVYNTIDYIGEANLPINTIGLEKGIQKTYLKLKNI